MDKEESYFVIFICSGVSKEQQQPLALFVRSKVPISHLLALHTNLQKRN